MYTSPVVFTHNTSDTESAGVGGGQSSTHLFILQLSEYQLGLQFSADTNYPEFAQVLQVKGSVSQDYPHLK